MLKNSPLLIAAACILGAALALAQEAPPADSSSAPNAAVEKKPDETKPAEHSATEKPGPKPTPKPAPGAATTVAMPELVATPTPKPQKPSFFQRLFGGRKRMASATPTPSASPTPSPTPSSRTRIVRKPVATPTPTPEASTPTPKPGRVPKATPTPKPSSTPKLDMPKVAPSTNSKVTPSGDNPKAPSATPAKASTATPAPAKAPTATPAKKPAIAKSSGTESKKPLIEPPADADPDVKERFHFDQAKAKASEDPQVKALKAKADDASTDEDSRKALRAYNKALFDKIRKIDGSVSERADRLEAAILKRLSE